MSFPANSNKNLEKCQATNRWITKKPQRLFYPVKYNKSNWVHASSKFCRTPSSHFSNCQQTNKPIESPKPSGFLAVSGSSTQAPRASASASGSIRSCWQLTDTYVLQCKCASGKRELCGITLHHITQIWVTLMNGVVYVIYVKPQSRNNKTFTPVFNAHWGGSFLSALYPPTNRRHPVKLMISFRLAKHFGSVGLSHDPSAEITSRAI